MKKIYVRRESVISGIVLDLKMAYILLKEGYVEVAKRYQETAVLEAKLFLNSQRENEN